MVAVADDLPRLASGFEHCRRCGLARHRRLQRVLRERLGSYAVDRGYEISSDLALKSCWKLSLRFESRRAYSCYNGLGKPTPTETHARRLKRALVIFPKALSRPRTKLPARYQ